jgi:hypothetical protein
MREKEPARRNVRLVRIFLSSPGDVHRNPHIMKEISYNGQHSQNYTIKPQNSFLVVGRYQR